jgi:hypothetical protein
MKARAARMREVTTSLHPRRLPPSPSLEQFEEPQAPVVVVRSNDHCYERFRPPSQVMRYQVASIQSSLGHLVDVQAPG